PFAERDIPSVMLFTGPHRDYNTAGDLPERIIPEKAAAVAHMALDLVRTLAARKDRLSWDTSMTDPPPADTWDRPY
ncbi:MAG: hypothetical protein KBA95_19930, partial [Acidobacteria bacterium]|nr:hypothetical protein [Acidobacteriota bacterium]